MVTPLARRAIPMDVAAPDRARPCCLLKEGCVRRPERSTSGGAPPLVIGGFAACPRTYWCRDEIIEPDCWRRDSSDAYDCSEYLPAPLDRCAAATAARRVVDQLRSRPGDIATFNEFETVRCRRRRALRSRPVHHPQQCDERGWIRWLRRHSAIEDSLHVKPCSRHAYRHTLCRWRRARCW